MIRAAIDAVGWCSPWDRRMRKQRGYCIFELPTLSRDQSDSIPLRSQMTVSSYAREPTAGGVCVCVRLD